MKKTGFIIDNLLTSQINVSIFNMASGFLFVKELTKTEVSNTLCVMDISEIWGFDDGVLIATSLDTAFFLQKSVNNSRKIFYLYDYNDIKESNDPDRIYELLTDPHVEVVVRSKHVKKKLKQHFNVNADHIWEDIDEYLCTEE